MKKTHTKDVKNQREIKKTKTQQRGVKNQYTTQAQCLRALSRSLVTIQEYRIANAHRLVRTPQSPKDTKEASKWKSKAEVLDDLKILAPLDMPYWKEYFKVQLKVFSEIEKWLQQRMKENLIGHPVWEGFLKDVKGVGPIIASSLIGEIGDINRFEQTSDLWAYCGKHVVNGLAARRRKGEQFSCNKFLNLILWKFSDAVIKVGSKTKSVYEKLYRTRKVYEAKKHNKTCKGTYTQGKYVKCKAPKMHIHLRSMRYVQKKLLSDLYWFWKSHEHYEKPIKPYRKNLL